jgi:hypothetical protein
MMEHQLQTFEPTEEPDVTTFMRTIHAHSNMTVHQAQTFGTVEESDVTTFMRTTDEYAHPNMMVHQVQTFGAVEEPAKSMFMPPYQIHPAQTLEQLTDDWGDDDVSGIGYANDSKHMSIT